MVPCYLINESKIKKKKKKTNYELDFVLRTDTSLIGCSGLLVQRQPLPDGLFQDIVIAIVSHKFTEQASCWAAGEQKAYAIFYCIKKLSYYLYRKPFIVETNRVPVCPSSRHRRPHLHVPAST